jgi:hypothetical protein
MADVAGTVVEERALLDVCDNGIEVPTQWKLRGCLSERGQIRQVRHTSPAGAKNKTAGGRRQRL